MEEKIVNIITEICNCEDIKNNVEVDLLANDILDSLALITLILRLNDEFDIEIQPTQVSFDTWRSVESIIKLVKKMRNSLKEFR